MAAGDITIFQQFKLNQNNGTDVIDFDTDNIKAMLVKSTYTPDAANHNFISQVNANEVSTGSSYSAGGPALAGVTLSLVGGNARFDANDVTIAQDGTGFTDAFYVVFYKDTGVAATSRVIAYGELGANKSIQTGQLVLQWNANGILEF